MKKDENNFIYKLALGLFFSLSLFVGCSQQSKDTPHATVETKKINYPSADEFSVLTCYSKKDYEEDLDQLVDSISNLHPKPFEFISEDDFLAFINIQKSRINNQTTVGEFFAICKTIVAKIGCGHSKMVKPENFTFPENLFFPIAVIFIDSSLIVCDKETKKLPLGTEILSINGKSVSKIRKVLGTFISSDGYNPSLINYSINSNFSFQYLLAFGFQSQFNIVAKNVKNEIIEVSGPGGQIRGTPSYFQSTCQESLCLELREESNAAILTIKTFSYYDDQFEIFKSFLDNSFEELRNKEIENLIIDLRGNGGGDPYCGSYLLEFIAKVEFVYFDNPLNGGYKSLSTMIQPKTDRYTGQVYVLTDGGCFSTTGHVCSLIKYHNMAQLIGEETGATYTCNGSVFNFELNHTKLKVNLSRNIFKTKVSGFSEHRGIMPDIVVKPTISDVVNGNDPVIPFVLNLIE